MDRRAFWSKLAAPVTAAIAVWVAASIPEKPPELITVGTIQCPGCLSVLDCSIRDEDRRPQGALWFVARHMRFTAGSPISCPNEGKKFKIHGNTGKVELIG